MSDLDKHLNSSPSQRRAARREREKVKARSAGPKWYMAFAQDQRGFRKDVDKDPVSETMGWHGKIETKTVDHPIPPTKITLSDIMALPPIDNQKGRAMRGRTIHPRMRVLQQLLQTDRAQVVERWHKQVLLEHGSWKFELYFSSTKSFLVEHTENQVKKSVMYDSRDSAMLHFNLNRIIWSEVYDIPPVSA